MKSGDSKVLQVTVKDEAGVAINITGATFTWALSKKKSSGGFSPTLLLTKTVGSGITLVTPASGRLDIALLPADTDALKGSYYQELQMVDTATNKSTVLDGTITIDPDLITT